MCAEWAGGEEGSGYEVHFSLVSYVDRHQRISKSMKEKELQN